MRENWAVNNINILIRFLLLVVALRLVVVLQDYALDERNEGINQDVLAFVIFAPHFEKSYQFIAYVAIRVMLVEKTQHLWSDPVGDLWYWRFVHFAKNSESIDWQIYAVHTGRVYQY